MLDERFEVVRRVNEIPDRCKLIFWSSLATLSGSRPKPEEIIVANPGEPFQASDNIVPGLPFRRLEFAGLGTARCFLHYQSGGGPPSFCLAVIDYQNQKIIWAGDYRYAARDLDELRRWVLQQRFRDTLGRGC